MCCLKISIQVLGQEVFSEKAESASCPAGDTESPAEEPQKLGLRNTALGPGGPLSCVVKEESDVEQGLGEGRVLVVVCVLPPGETRGL